MFFFFVVFFYDNHDLMIIITITNIITISSSRRQKNMGGTGLKFKSWRVIYITLKMHLNNDVIAFWKKPESWNLAVAWKNPSMEKDKLLTNVSLRTLLFPNLPSSFPSSLPHSGLSLITRPMQDPQKNTQFDTSSLLHNLRIFIPPPWQGQLIFLSPLMWSAVSIIFP